MRRAWIYRVIAWRRCGWGRRAMRCNLQTLAAPVILQPRPCSAMASPARVGVSLRGEDMPGDTSICRISDRCTPTHQHNSCPSLAQCSTSSAGSLHKPTSYCVQRFGRTKGAYESANSGPHPAFQLLRMASLSSIIAQTRTDFWTATSARLARFACQQVISRRWIRLAGASPAHPA